MSLEETIYWIFNTPYYRVTIVKDLEVLTVLTQKVLTDKDYEPQFIISKKYKKAWVILKNNCFRDGKAYTCMADLDNAIPLIEKRKEETVKEYLKGFITKDVSINTMKTTSPINFGKDVEIKTFKEIAISPDFVFKMIKQGYIKEIISEDAPEIPKWIILLLLGAVGIFIIWQFVFHGQIPFIGGN